MNYMEQSQALNDYNDAQHALCVYVCRLIESDDYEAIKAIADHINTLAMPAPQAALQEAV